MKFQAVIKVFFVVIVENGGMDKGKEVLPLYKSQEKKLIWLSFGVAIIMLLSILGRIFGS